MIVLVPTLFEMRRLFPDVPAIGGVPAAWPAVSGLDGRPPRVAPCGFGLSAAGARAAAILARSPGEACVLAGLAGTYDASRLAPGAAFIADRVEIEGIGIPGSASAAITGPLADEPEEPLPALEVPPDLGFVAGLLSVATPSATPAEARERAARHPRCLAEDMEAHAVLVAAGATGTALAVVRGISNRAGDRDHATWRVDAALHAVRGILDRLAASEWPTRTGNPPAR